MIIEQFSNELVTQIVRVVTGQLFTKEQIKKITKNSVGRYLEGMFPEDEDQLDRSARLTAARVHIENASTIMAGMRVELDAQTEALNHLLAEIEEKKSLAEKYSALAEANQDAVSAMRIEIENAIRQELIRQSNQGKNIRRFVSAIIWLFTLILGAALGTYFKEVLLWLTSLSG